MAEELKSLKQYCREAKKRLKSGFWAKYQEELKKEIQIAKESGVPESKVKEYFVYKVSNGIKDDTPDTEQNFYKRVKDILDAEGEVSDIIGRLTDHTYFQTLSYDERQRYTLSLSERYLKALEKYRKEKSLEYRV